MCLIPKAAAGSAADTRHMLIARLHPLQELKTGSRLNLLSSFSTVLSFDIVYNVSTREQVLAS